MALMNSTVETHQWISTPESRKPIARTIAAGLSSLLADSYTLYLKTHNYHWNVEGPQFNTLHQMFEVQYTELATAVDEIAERIRALGVKAPGSYCTVFSDLTSVDEAVGDESAEEMIRQLAIGQETDRTNGARRIPGCRRRERRAHR